MFLWRNLSPSALAAVAAALTKAKTNTESSVAAPVTAKDAIVADNGIAKN